ncbi:MAG: hypothetical protein LLG37_01395 [Spirochaetia bacterium]|nr:hypothetical protein [Spirochaetia bacterium]
MKKLFMFVIVPLLLLASCSSMYIKPTIETVIYKQEVPGNTAFLFQVVKAALPLAGYKVADSSIDKIMTDPVEVTLDPGMCDCGTTMLGLPIIKTAGTKAQVRFGIGVETNRMTITAEIKPVLDDELSLLLQGIQIACVSTGKLEETLAKKLLSSIRLKF